MPGQEESVDLRGRVVEEGAHDGRDEFLRGEQEEIFKSLPLRREYCRRLGRGGRFEADREEYDFFLRMRRRSRECIERRVDDADVRARRLRRGEARCAPGDFQHVAEGRDDDVLLPRVRNRGVDVGVVRDADGTAGA